MAIPQKVKTTIVIQSRRRCCICFGLHNDAEPKQGQFAHLDHNPANNGLENIAYLCLPHHDQYDSKTSQSAGMTREELLHFRNELYQFVKEQAAAFRTEAKVTKQALDYWTYRKGPSKVEIDEALEFFAGPHRTRSVMLLLDEAPRTLSEIQAAVPGEPTWIETIADAVVKSGWAFEPNENQSQYRISSAGIRLLRVLDAIPDFIKNAAWDANWRPDENKRK